MPLLWRDVVYGNDSIFKELFEYQKRWLKTLIDDKTSFVEVGCGTCEMGATLFQQARYTVHIDINPSFLDLAKELHPDLAECPTNYFVQGESSESIKTALEGVMPQEFWSTKRVVCMFMNTLGLVDSAGSLQRMLELAGPTGTVIAGCWHSESFELGVREFYGRNPIFCGDINDPSTIIDVPNANMIIRSTDYETHWFSAEELRAFVDEKVYDVKTQVVSVGIFLIISAKKDAANTAEC